MQLPTTTGKSGQILTKDTGKDFPRSITWENPLIAELLSLKNEVNERIDKIIEDTKD